MVKKRWVFWLGMLAVFFMAIEGALLLWEPLLPHGIFVTLSTISGVASKVLQYTVSSKVQLDLMDDGVINDSV